MRRVIVSDQIFLNLATGELVTAYSVTGRELPDGSIELIGISIDFEGLTDPDDDEAGE